MVGTRVFSALRVKNKINLFVDMFDVDPKTKTCQTANQITFMTRYLFTHDVGQPMIELTREEAKDLIDELSQAMKEE